MQQSSPSHATATTTADLLLSTQNLADGGPWVSKTTGSRCSAVSKALALSRAEAAALERQEIERREAAARARKPRWWLSDQDPAGAVGELYEGIYDEWWARLEALWEARYEEHFGRGLPDGTTFLEEICRDAGTHVEAVHAISPHVRRSLWLRVDVESRRDPVRLLDVLRRLCQGPFRLMDLPPCVRVSVYELFEGLEWRIAAGWMKHGGGGQWPLPAVMHVSRELREAAVSMMTLRIHFDIWADEEFSENLLGWYHGSWGRRLALRVNKIHISVLATKRYLGLRQHVLLSWMGKERRWSVSQKLSRLGEMVKEETWQPPDKLLEHIEAALQAARDAGGEPLDAVIATAVERWQWTVAVGTHL
jgi:hypothetical protein